MTLSELILDALPLSAINRVVSQAPKKGKFCYQAIETIELTSEDWNVTIN